MRLSPSRINQVAREAKLRRKRGRPFSRRVTATSQRGRALINELNKLSRTARLEPEEYLRRAAAVIRRE